MDMYANAEAIKALGQIRKEMLNWLKSQKLRLDSLKCEEDIVQDSWLEHSMAVAERSYQFSDDKGFENEVVSLRCWLYTTATFKVLECLRDARLKMKREAKLAEQNQHLLKGVVIDDIDQPLIHGEMSRFVDSILSQMPDRDREAFVAVYLEDRAREEVAEQFNTSVKNLAVMLCRAKKKVRERVLSPIAAAW